MKFEIEHNKLIKCKPDYDYEDIVIPENIIVIDDFAFDELKINKMTIPSTVKYMKEHSIFKCEINELCVQTESLNETIMGKICESEIKHLIVENSIVPIQLTQATQIEHLEFKGTKIINSRAFLASDIHKITGSEQLEAIMDHAFECAYFSQVFKFPETLKYIGVGAFCDAVSPKFNIKEAIEKTNVYYLGKSALKFINVDNNEVINLKPGYEALIIDDIYIKYTGKYRNKTDEYKIPSGIKRIFGNAFLSDDFQATKIICSHSIEKIDKSAFTFPDINSKYEVLLPQNKNFKISLFMNNFSNDVTYYITKSTYLNNLTILSSKLIHPERFKIRKLTIDELLMDNKTTSEINQMLKEEQESEENYEK